MVALIYSFPFNVCPFKFSGVVSSLETKLEALYEIDTRLMVALTFGNHYLDSNSIVILFD